MNNFDWKKEYTGNLDWLNYGTIFLTESGSHSYGTAGPDSDLDFKGVCVPPASWVLGFVHPFEQADKAFTNDTTIYELRKFFKLAAECNPNIIELLWIDESNWRIANDNWKFILSHRDKFLSKNAKARFSGYAVSQLKRINTDRHWLLHPPDHQPTREEFGLPEFSVIPRDQLEAAKSQIQKQIDSWQLDLSCIDEEAVRLDLKNRIADNLTDMQLNSDRIWDAAARKLNFSDNFLELLGKERGYRGAMAEWKQYSTWLSERNPTRALLEKQFGYDTKHAAHLVRLMRMCREILEGRGVIVKRPDAEELRDIRFKGAWNYEQLVEWAAQQDAELEELKATSKLPAQPNRAALNVVCSQVMQAEMDL